MVVSSGIYIYSKFTEKTAAEEGLTYGVNAFKTLDDFLNSEYASQLTDIPIILRDSKNTVTPEQFTKIALQYFSLRGNYSLEGSDEDAVTEAKNSLTITGPKRPDNVEVRDFLNVTVKDSKIPGTTISKDNLLSKKQEYGKSKYNDDEDFKYRTVTLTKTSKNNGSVTISNSKVASIRNYDTVTLLNSSVGGVYLTPEYTSTYKGEQRYDSESKKWDSEIAWNDYWEDDAKTKTASSGTFTFTLDKNADQARYFIGNDENGVSGYSTVTITGLEFAKNPDKKEIIVRNSITGGKGENFFDGEIYSPTASGSIKVANAVKLYGSLKFFSTVNVSHAVYSDITAGYSSMTEKTTEKTQNTSEGKAILKTITRTFKSGTKATITNSLLNNSLEGGNEERSYQRDDQEEFGYGDEENELESNSRFSIINYDTVSLTNSSAGDITRDTLTKIVRNVKYWGEEDGEGSFIDEKRTYTAAGSVTIKADKNGIDLADFAANRGEGSDDIYDWEEGWDEDWDSDSGYTVVYDDVEDDFEDDFEDEAGGEESGDDDEIEIEPEKKSKQFTVGNIRGYAKVTASGYVDKTTPENSIGLVVGSIIGGDKSIVRNGYEDTTATISSSGSVSLSDNVEVRGQIQYYTTVTIKNSEIELPENMAVMINENMNGENPAVPAVILRGGNDFKTKSSSKTVVDADASDEYTKFERRTTSITTTYSTDGKLTAENADIDGNIQNYEKVTLTNTEAGDIILDNLYSVKEERYATRSGEKEDGKWSWYEWEEEEDGKIIAKKYKSSGSATVTINKNGWKKADIDEDDGTREISVGSISGYEEVSLSGYVDKNDSSKNVKLVTGAITGGEKSVTPGETADDEVVVTNYNSGSITISGNTEVEGDISFFEKVEITNSEIEAKIIGGAKTSSSKTSKKTTSSSFDGTKYESQEITETVSFKDSGKLTVKNSEIENSIQDYKTVSLTNTEAGDISRDTTESFVWSTWKNRYAEKQSGKWVWSDWIIDDSAVLKAENHAAAGSVTIKADKNGIASAEFDEASNVKAFSVGSISGYSKVTVNGYTDSKKVANNIKIFTGEITGGKASLDHYSHGDQLNLASGSLSLDFAEIRTSENLDDIPEGTAAVTGFDSVSITNAAIYGDVTLKASYADGETVYCGSAKISSSEESSKDGYFKKTFKAADKFSLTNSTLKGSVKGYNTVSVSNSTVTGGIDLGTAYTSSVESQNTSKKYTREESFKESTSGKITVKNSEVKGLISGYNEVTLLNSNIGDVANFIYTYSSDFAYDHKTDKEKESSLATYKASGSIKITADKNAKKDEYKTGSIRGFEKVTISGYESKSKDADVITGDILGGKYEVKNDVLTKSATGSVTLSKEAEVDGTIYGYSKVTATDAVITGDITSDFQIPEAEEKSLLFAQSYTDEIIGKTVKLTDSVVAGKVSGYKELSIAGESFVGTYAGTSGANTLTIAKKAILHIDSLESEGSIKVVLDGTLVFDGNAAPISGKITQSGKGEVAAAASVYDLVAESGFKKVYNIGDTTANFRGTAYEKADNSRSKAVKLENLSMYEGWMGGWTGYAEGADTIDNLAFKATKDSALLLDFEGSSDIAWSFYTKKGKLVSSDQWTSQTMDDGSILVTGLAAGDYVLELKNTNTDNASLSYSVILA